MKIFALLLVVYLATTAMAQEENVFGYRDVVQIAEALSKQPFAPQNQELSPDLQNLDYDLYRRIRFLPERSVWRNLPYCLGFFHPGYYYKRRVLFREIEKDRLRDIPFSPDYFYYDHPLIFSGHESFVGFKAFVPSSQPGIQDEFMSFLGASYFRAIAKGLHWGLSCRGLAVNAGLGRPEEFPDPTASAPSSSPRFFGCLIASSILLLKSSVGFIRLLQIISGQVRINFTAPRIDATRHRPNVLKTVTREERGCVQAPNAVMAHKHKFLVFRPFGDDFLHQLLSEKGGYFNVNRIPFLSAANINQREPFACLQALSNLRGRNLHLLIGLVPGQDCADNFLNGQIVVTRTDLGQSFRRTEAATRAASNVVRSEKRSLGARVLLEELCHCYAGIQCSRYAHDSQPCIILPENQRAHYFVTFVVVGGSFAPPFLCECAFDLRPCSCIKEACWRSAAE
jgi:hypothetical protein